MSASVQTNRSRRAPVRVRSAQVALKHPGRRLLAALGLLLLLYYLAYGLLSNNRPNTAVDVKGGSALTTSADNVALHLRVTAVDPPSRTMDVEMRPVASGRYASSTPGELAQPVRVQMFSSGAPATSASFPNDSIVDAVTVQMPLSSSVQSYPLDSPQSNVRLQVVNDKTDAVIPASLVLQNAATPWLMSASVSASGGQLLTSINAHRSNLSILLTIFQLLAIVATTMIAVSTVGSALLARTVDFSKVIWLSATLIAFPALRSSMPGVPPIGTTMDFLFFFPCVCIIAAALVWTTLEVAWKERPTRIPTSGATQAAAEEVLLPE